MEPSEHNTDLPTLSLRDSAKDIIGPNGSLYFFNESSLDSSSATPSPDEDLKSSSTSLSSNPVSSPEEAKTSSVAFITGPQTNAVDTEAEDDIPLLKGAGNSDCAVSVVGFHGAKKLCRWPPYLTKIVVGRSKKILHSVSTDRVLEVRNSEVMQGVLENAGSILLDPYKNEVFMNGSRASQVGRLCEGQYCHEGTTLTSFVRKVGLLVPTRQDKMMKLGGFIRS